MLAYLADNDGRTLDAKVDIEDGSVALHSRGGAFGKPNLRNPDYRRALQLILERLRGGQMSPSGVWLDSSVARTWPEDERRLVEVAELGLPVEELVSLIGQRGSAKGRSDSASGHGNSTKRIIIRIPRASAKQLGEVLRAASNGSEARLPAETLRLVGPSMIDDAIAAILAGAEHCFGESRDYDVLLPSGERLPPKAVFGLALQKVLGRPALPSDFSAGWGQPCFDIIEHAGYPIVGKGELAQKSADDVDDERSWAEGSTVLLQHLRRERAPGLARMKKRRFAERHGHLFCERCGVVPSESLGPFGDACIEVHHATVAVAKMDAGARTRLDDLQCLCANCHRIVHREQL